ncbi:protein LSM14 homolog B isoform X1 [Poecilia latipinna]|uniref:LSM family member 14B n=1 Tax=Poecilia latipinna TaxID=48699 RepID=A0A3B3VAQ4_9TELE|nr:PREDICTED: protein LSM14 homolog B isoform X1 [Poecilia latipinna]
MASSKPYIGCRIGLISKAQNRYEGILYTIDKNNSTVVLAKVKCFGTEGRPTERPTPPKDDVYEYITFRGSDIKDIALCESPRSYHGLPPDPAIIQSSSSSSGIYPSLGLFSPIGMPVYNHLAASSLLSQQYAAALGLDLHFRRGPMVEKAVQTIQVERRRGLTTSQERQWNKKRPPRTRRVNSQPQKEPTTRSSGSGVTSNRSEAQRQKTDRPLARRRQASRHRSGSGQLMMANVPSPILKFDTDFDFASSNAQFIKEELEREVQERRNLKDEDIKKAKARMHALLDNDSFSPKCYYDKAKSFFDNVSCDNGLSFRLTWAEERKRNLETFGVSGRFVRGRGLRGRFTGRRGRGAAQILSLDRIQTGWV